MRTPQPAFKGLRVNLNSNLQSLTTPLLSYDALKQCHLHDPLAPSDSVPCGSKSVLLTEKGILNLGASLDALECIGFKAQTIEHTLLCFTM